MRSLPALVSAAALLGAACTNDYDMLLEGASGGGSPASTAATGATTSDASSSSASVSGSSSASTGDASSSASSAGGDGGNGEGGDGDGGDGGNGEGGGGEGGDAVLPGAMPCDIAVDLESDDLPPGWDIDTDRCSATVEGGTLIVASTADDFSAASLYYRFEDDEFRDCSVATSVIDFDGSNGATDLAAYLGLFGPDDFFLARVRIRDGDPWRNDVVLGDGPSSEVVAGPDDEADQPPSRIRIRAHDDDVSFDVVEDGEWKRIHTMSRADLGPEISGISVGASRRSDPDESGDTKVVIGPVNDD